MADDSETTDRPGAQRWVPEGATLPQLREAVQECRGCELWQDTTQAVMGDGLPQARLVLLGEQPGDQEDRQGKPFVGPAGRLLVQALDEAGIDRADTYRTNVVKHFRFRGRGKQRIHQTPNQVHVTACAPWLAAEFTQLQPVGVVVLGGTAGKLVFGSAFRVGEMRGSLTDWPERFPVANAPQWVLPTTHPSAVLRAEDQREAAYSGLVADLRIAAEALRGA
ncbi:UdgX family uracil-DNA binding protein [Nocardioides anomalus]|uniref:Type-4 uracil-DNA glycosylase n=1 Tax=Nocardioides anomalus TaxID=2712223 RepID=A0A6G6W9Q8_9ACTN|nr:UdgX family uracil-DNA binding protein [Nocardioides anomalus]QIG41883.1 UdgX family uracil-DNA binding protein [Nocardioides anomalus]